MGCVCVGCILFVLTMVVLETTLINGTMPALKHGSEYSSEYDDIAANGASRFFIDNIVFILCTAMCSVVVGVMVASINKTVAYIIGSVIALALAKIALYQIFW